MSSSKLPERASLEYLKKLAKDRLQELRRAHPRAKLATALLAVARDHGFPSWRALKAEVEQRQTREVALFFEACVQGDVETLRGLLGNDPSLVRAGNADRSLHGWTGLHAAAARGQVDAVRLLLAHGADPNARDTGDNAYALHFAAGSGRLETVRALLDAGGDVHGFGDVHEADVIGWATALRPPGEIAGEVVSLLLERGARHHIFSAIAVGDLDLIQKLVEENPEALDRRMSRFEQEQSPLHFALSRKRYDILDLLIDLGADLEAENKSGKTPLAVAMLRGDREAMSRLHAAGAKPPDTTARGSFKASMARLAGSVRKGVPMIGVPDIAATLSWYASIGFTELSRYEDDGLVNFGMLSFGRAELMLRLQEKPGPRDMSLWFYTDKIDDLYQLLKSRQLESAQAALAGKPHDPPEIEFVEDLYDPFYGGRQFSIRDLNGYTLVFLQD
ncbi:MAG TPA: ankyrin repeat domain-containing protein [Thermoanaerobaculia bacterium]|nr:ankyrin repeat domain-containing protein [Thermoanaerobaculia bacterium]